MKHKEKNIFLLLLTNFVFFFFLIQILFGDQEKGVNNYEKRIFNAIQKEFLWHKPYEIKARPFSNKYFKKSTLFNVKLYTYTEPSRSCIAALNSNDEIFIFFPYKGFKNFSRIIKEEDIEIDKTSVRKYIESLLFLTGGGSYLINNLGDIKNEIYPEIKTEFEKHKKVVKPLVLKNGKTIIIRFFSWSRSGLLLKWNLEVKHNGEILKHKIDEIGNYVSSYGHR